MTSPILPSPLPSSPPTPREGSSSRSFQFGELITQAKRVLITVIQSDLPLKVIQTIRQIATLTLRACNAAENFILAIEELFHDFSTDVSPLHVPSSLPRPRAPALSSPAPAPSHFFDEEEAFFEGAAPSFPPALYLPRATSPSLPFPLLQERIELLESEKLIELLSDLHLLLAQKNHPSSLSSFRPILEWGLSLTHSLRSPTDPKEETALVAAIGKLAFLTNHSPNTLLPLIDLSSPSVTSRNLEEAFQQHLIKEKKTLAPLLPPENSRSFSLINTDSFQPLSLTLAQLLIQDTGSLNFGIIPSLLHSFFPLQTAPECVLSKIQRTLLLLYTSPQLRQQLNQMDFSSPFPPSSAALIRATLALPALTPIEPFHGKITALSALFSHLRQGEANSCFATFLAIQLLENAPHQCLQDFHQLLTKGALKRECEGTLTSFPFLIKTPSPSLKQAIEVQEGGWALFPNSPPTLLWENPGFLAAARALKHSSPQAIYQKILDNLASQRGFPFTTTPQELLTSLCQLSSSPTSTAFSAREAMRSSPLLRAWSNAIAGLPEGCMSGSIKKRSLESVAKCLLKRVSTYGEGEKKELNRFFDLFYKELIQRSRFQYDPSFSHTSLAWDQRSTEGAYLLHDSNGQPFIEKWSPIDTPQKFQNYIFQIAQEAWRKLHPLETPFPLASYLLSSQFLLDALYFYDLSNLFATSPLQDFQNLPYTPWIDRRGGNTQKVLQVYFEHSSLPSTFKSSPQNAQELLETILDYGKELSETTQKKLINQPTFLLPVRTPGRHAFNLMLGHPSLKEGWTGEIPTHQWIHTHLLEPGQALSHAPCAPSTREKVERYSAQCFLPQKLHQAFFQATSALPHKLSIQGYREQLLHILKKLGSFSRETLPLIERQIDGHLVQALTHYQRQHLAACTLHFADTNWGMGAFNQHFCFLLNPGSGKVELWTVLSHNQGYWPLNQKSWVQEQIWEFFLNP